MSISAIHLVIHGRVQAVGYRKWAQATAKKLGLNGWVRNRTDGTVELVAAGETSDLVELQKACERGPLAARVLRVEASPWSGDVPKKFEQLETPD